MVKQNGSGLMNKPRGPRSPGAKVIVPDATVVVEVVVTVSRPSSVRVPAQ